MAVAKHIPSVWPSQLAQRPQRLHTLPYQPRALTDHLLKMRKQNKFYASIQAFKHSGAVSANLYLMVAITFACVVPLTLQNTPPKEAGREQCQLHDGRQGNATYACQFGQQKLGHAIGCLRSA